VVTTALIKTLYTARATAHGGRSGHVVSSDGIVDVNLQPPKEMGGPGAGTGGGPGSVAGGGPAAGTAGSGPAAGTNPEQLFAAGYAACFQSALAVVGRRAGVDTSGSLVEADVSIGTIGGGGYGLAVVLKIAIPGADRDTVRSLTDAAHQVCPYSNATRGNIDVTLEVD